MYQNEIDKLSKKIDGQNIRNEAKKALHNIVEEFFSIDYHKISEKRKREIENNFEIRRLECKMVCTIFDVDEVEKTLNRIENYLFTILDQSVDKISDKKSMDISKLVKHNKEKIVIGIIITVIGTVIAGIILNGIQLASIANTQVNISMEKNESENDNNQITQVIVLEPKWVYKNNPILVFNNQILIEVSSPSSFIQCATFDLNIQNNNSIRFTLMCIGKREQFSYNNQDYLFDVLDITDRGAKITISRFL